MQLQNKAAVIFDLDGVLVSTDELHFEAWKRLALEINITNYTKKDNARQRGVSRMESLEILLEKSGASYSKREKEALADLKNNYYAAALEGVSPNDVLSGALETIYYLKKEKVLLAVGSSSKNAKTILRKTGLIGCFDVIADGCDAAKSKPDPEIFLTAAKRLGVPAGACVVAEDSDSGIRAAILAGMKTLAVGAAFENPAADFRAKSLSDPSICWEKILKKF